MPERGMGESAFPESGGESSEKSDEADPLPGTASGSFSPGRSASRASSEVLTGEFMVQACTSVRSTSSLPTTPTSLPSSTTGRV